MQYNEAPIIKIGKSGWTQELITHVKKLLKKHKIIKLRFLKSTTINTNIFEKNIVKKIGRIIVLKKN